MFITYVPNVRTYTYIYTYTGIHIHIHKHDIIIQNTVTNLGFKLGFKLDYYHSFNSQLFQLLKNVTTT